LGGIGVRSLFSAKNLSEIPKFSYFELDCDRFVTCFEQKRRRSGLKPGFEQKKVGDPAGVRLFTARSLVADKVGVMEFGH